ncbi:hypothetical protein XENTR_v10024860 [Xenopus tropicalis]|nr:hypothetical protein XENTR_v10024860 [Xenopus tropicalis]
MFHGSSVKGRTVVSIGQKCTNVEFIGLLWSVSKNEVIGLNRDQCFSNGIHLSMVESGVKDIAQKYFGNSLPIEKHWWKTLPMFHGSSVKSMVSIGQECTNINFTGLLWSVTKN